MKIFLEFARLGLGAGGIYGLAALGLIIVYRGSGVINLAHGAIGMVGAYLFWELHDNHNWPFFAAFAIGIVVPALLGLFIHYFLMRPMRNSSRVNQMMLTLGVLIVLESVAEHRYPQIVNVVPPFLPTSTWTIFGVIIGKDRLTLFFMAVAIGAGLYALYRYTSFGRRTTAVAENRRNAAALAHSPDRIAGANWALGSALAALAAIMIAPISGLQPEALTLLVIPALAAAVTGNLVSFPITIGAALFIGIAQSELTNYTPNVPGTDTAVPLILIVLYLMAKGSTLPDRAQVGVRMWTIGNGHITAARILPLVAGAMMALIFAPLVWVSAITVSITFGCVILSILVVTGYSGQLSLAQWTLAGCGALVAVRISAGLHWPFLICLLCTAIAMVPIGMIVGLPALRTRGANLAIITLALSSALTALVFNSVPLAGGPNGISVANPTLFGWNINDVTEPRRYAAVAVVIFALLIMAVGNVRRGRSGRRLIAVRENERAAAAMGINVVGAKLYAFSLAAAIAGIGGVLYTLQGTPTVLFTNYTPDLSETVVAFAVIGGLGFLIGPFVGSFFATGGVGSQVSQYLGSWIAAYLNVIGGAVLIMNLLQSPDGVTAPMTKLIHRIRGSASSTSPSTSSLETNSSGRISSARQLTLEVSHLSVRFGGVVAVDDLSFSVRPGEIVGLIGPNGAGKTTVLDAISGFIPSAVGEVTLGTNDVSRFKPHARARAGLCRSFQSVELLGDITVHENLLIAADRRDLVACATDLVHPGRGELWPSTLEALSEFDLRDVVDMQVKELPYATRRLVGVARAVAAEPAVVMLDEPAAGLDDAATSELARLIRFLATEQKMAVLLVEHNVELVLGLCDRVIAIDSGRMIASGTPDEVKRHPEVIRAYLGEELTDELSRQASEALLRPATVQASE